MCSRTSTPSACGAADKLPGDRGRVGDSVLRAEHRAEHVAGLEPIDERRVDALDRDAEAGLDAAALLELGEALLGGREEEVADLVEERRPELREEGDALAGEQHLGGRSRTAGARRPSPSRSSRRPIGPRSQSTTSPAPPQRELVGDARADRAASRNEDHGS